MSDKHVITKISHIDLLSSFIQGCHFLLNIYIQLIMEMCLIFQVKKTNLKTAD